MALLWEKAVNIKICIKHAFIFKKKTLPLLNLNLKLLLTFSKTYYLF